VAYIVGELAAPIKIDDKPFQEGLQKTKQAGENWALETGKSLSKTGKELEKVGKKWTTGVTLPIVGAGTAVIMTAANFEASMNRVRGLTGATGSDLEKLTAQARELGATTQYSASDAADAMGFLAMAGFKTNDILGAMPGTLELAASAQMDLASAADITSNILTGYGKDVEELGHVNDVLVKAMTSANVDLRMLGESMKYAGPVAAGVGMQFEEVAAAIGMMGNAGIQGSMAGTALRGAISVLTNPTKQAYEKMAELGLEVTDTNGKIKSLTGIVKELEDSGASTADMMALFGQRAGPAMVALVDQGSGALADFTKSLEDSEGAAKAVASVNMEGAKGAMLELKSAGEALAISIADSGLLQNVTDTAKGFANWLRELSETNPEMLKLITNVALVVAAAGPLISITGKVSQGIGGVMTLAGKLNSALKTVKNTAPGTTGSLGGFGGKLGTLAAAAGPIALTVTALAGLGTAFYILDSQVNEKTKSIEQQVKERFTKAVETAGREVAKMNKQVSDEFEGMTNNVLGQLLNLKIGADEVSEETYQGIIDEVDNMRTRALELLEQHNQEGLQALNNYHTEAGTLNSEEYAADYKALQSHYADKTYHIESSYDNINQIIARAMAEGREVTQEEWDTILAILEGTNDEIIDKERWLEGELAAVMADIGDGSEKATRKAAENVIAILKEHHQGELDEIAAHSDERIKELITAYSRGEITTKEELDKQLQLVKEHELEKTLEAKEAHMERLRDQQWALDAMGLQIHEGSGELLTAWEMTWSKIKEQNNNWMEDMRKRTSEGYYGVAAAAWSSYEEATEEKRPEVQEAAKLTIDDVIAEIEAAKDRAKAGGEGISSGVVKGILAGREAAVKAAEELANSINQKFRTTLEIASPSRVMEEAGFEIPAGAAKGIIGGLGMVRSAVDDMISLISLPRVATAGAGGATIGNPVTNSTTTNRYNVTLNIDPSKLKTVADIERLLSTFQQVARAGG
jgi:TP901 family phage tail tape measure protein